jgi:NNP family nitrate/nitrite transporter-like MFS transporter
MRAFHLNWWGFFCAFFIWFGIAPLLGDIADSLHLTKQQLWTSSIVSVGGTIPLSLVLGPLCDKFGARILFTAVLCIAAIPTACTGLIHSASDLILLRLGIGIAGGSFVM